ncbi:radical SAM domain protein (plasmid) [Haliovirga abyssi]|uniref:Radical SAM domain protein n=2 Tax=Haliovirga abyssi TaxID=2996794 RepID=A0AAU9DL57_9FUSO|nr:radical SAM domain protein [Haliovirga abyssi]
MNMKMEVKMSEALVNKIIPFSNVDGPGNRTAVFLQGCNLNCLYCHNPETINICNNCGKCVTGCPADALEISNGRVIWDSDKCINCDTCIKVCPNSSTPKVKKYSVKEVMKIILEYKNFISGITFSGGECTLNHQFIVEVFKEVHKYGLTCFVDTNGFLDFENLPELVKNTDKFMLDIKAWDSSEHIKLTGKDNNIIKKNLEYLIKLDKIYEIRTVVVPEILDNENSVVNVSEILSGTEIQYKLIKFRKNGVRLNLINVDMATDSYMEKLKNRAIEIGVKKVVIT